MDLGAQDIESRLGLGAVARPSRPATPAPVLPATVEARAERLMAKLMQRLAKTNITVSLPTHVEPHLWSEPLDLSSRVVLPAAVTDYTPVITYKVPPGRWLRVNGYGMNDPNAAFTYDGSVLWAISVDGNYPGGLYDIAQQRGSLVQPRSTFIVAREDQVVTFSIRRAVAAGGTTTFDMGLTGWTWRPRTNAEGTRASVTAF